MELLLTMAIIMILSVIGIGSYTQATLKSRDTQRKNDLNQMAKAIEVFNLDMGRYPSDDGNGVILCPNVAGEDTECRTSIYAYLNGERSTYMDYLPLDPIQSRIYYYENILGGGYAIYAALENEEDRDVVVDGDNVKTDWGKSCGINNNCNYKLTEVGLMRTLVSPTPTP